MLQLLLVHVRHAVIDEHAQLGVAHDELLVSGRGQVAVKKGALRTATIGGTKAGGGSDGEDEGDDDDLTKLNTAQEMFNDVKDILDFI